MIPSNRIQPTREARATHAGRSVNNDMIQKIPVFFRAPIALLSDAIIFFGPIALGLYILHGTGLSVLSIILGIPWLILCHRCFLWRLDVFWNLKSSQNMTNKPPCPDNHRVFKTFKGQMIWLLLGKDIEKKNTEPGHGGRSVI